MAGGSRRRAPLALLLGFSAAVLLSVAGGPAASASGGTDLVTSFTTSTLRNNFSGWVGMRIQGGSSDVSVASLGRWVVSGNSQSHAVRLVLASTGADVATATVATSGQPAGAFAFTDLGAPVTLLANTTYYLLSQETFGGDQWYDYNTATTTTSAAADTGAVWATNGAPGAFNVGGSAGQSYGVPNLRYASVNAAPAITQQPADQTVTAGGTAVFTAAASGVPTPTVQWEAKPPAGSFAAIGGATSTLLTVPNVAVGDSGTQYRAVFSNTSGPSATTNAATLTVNASPPPSGTAFVTYFTPSSLRNDFSGWVGMRVQGGASDISVTSLGRWVVSGNSQSHSVRLVLASTGTDVATATVATSGQPAGTFAFTDLGSPVTLLANTTYYLLSQETAGGDTWYDYNTSTITTSAATDTGVVWSTAGAPNAFNPGGGAQQAFVVPNFRYTSVASAPAVTQQPADQTVAAGGTAVFSAAASGVPTPTVQWESKPPAGSFGAIGGATSTVLTVPNVTVADSGTQYRAVFSNSSGPSATTNAATLTVNASPPPSGTPLVTYFSTSPLRNDFSGWVGMRVQVGAHNVSVGSLGRWVVSGNSQAHNVRLVHVDTGTQVATASVATSGQPAGAFAYTVLGSPVTLQANTNYYLLSEEFAGGDTWYDYNTATITTSDGSDTGAVWATAGAPGTYYAGGSNGQSYGVPNLTYTVLNSAPTDISLSASSVAENQPSGTDVGTFSTTDADAGDTHTYSLVTGTGDSGNASFTISGNTLKTAASFDFETTSSYSIRVQTQDSGAGNLTFQKQFTITVTNVNDAPTDITLSSSSVAENQPANTTVGTLGATDQDAGQTHTFALVAGAGSDDNGSFNISGTSLRTSASFNFEAKNSYSIRVQTTDNGAPNLTFEKVFTISITDVNDPPVTVNDTYSGAVGNTLFVLNSGGSGPKRVVTGSVITANDTDEDVTFPHTLSAVAETVTSTGGGTATITADGNFTFLPGVGDINQTDTFVYHVTDGSLTTSGTVSVTIGAERVWYVDNALGSNGDGRSSSPFNVLSAVNAAGDPDGSGDYLFLFQGSGNYTGGLVLETNQLLIGQPEGLVVGGNTLYPASGTNPTITNNGGAGITLANGNTIRRVSVANASGAGITGTSVTSADIGPNLSISGSTGTAFNLTGSGTGTITMAGSITHSSATSRSVSIANRTGGTVTMSGAITDTAGGISLSTNTGATISFTGGMSVSSGGNTAFAATGGGTVTVTGTNTLTNTATALNFSGTSIGVSGLTFQSINSNGGANGIVLNGTGSAGGLSVTGTGSAGTGGTIQGKSGDGISLTNVGGVVSLTNMATTTVSGADVLLNGGAANVTYTGTISSSAGRSVDVSNKTGGTVAFSGAVNDTGTGISLTSNGGATINFTGGLTMSTGVNPAFAATGGGTVNVTGSANTISTTTGTALNVSSTTIGASGLTFRSISAGTAASGPTNGIVLNNTGSGALTIAGTGSANSGGTIQKTSGDAISLTSASNISLSWIQVINNLGSGLNGTTITNFTLSNSTFDGNGDDGAADEAGIRFTNLVGTSTWTNVTVAHSIEDNARVLNNAGTLSQLTITNSTFRDTATADPGNNGLLIESDGTASITADITGSSFLRNRANGLQVVTNSSGSVNIDLGTATANSGGTFQDNNIGVNIAHNSSGTLPFTVKNATLSAPNKTTAASPINLNLGAAATGSGMQGTVANNTISNNNSATGPGIRVVSNGAGTMTVLLTANNISAVAAQGILVQARDGSSTLNATITSNVISLPTANPATLDGIRVDAGATSTDTVSICAQISSNNSTTAAGFFGARIRQRFTNTHFTLEGYGGSATDDSAVAAFLNANNTLSPGASADHGGAGFATTANCPTPA